MDYVVIDFEASCLPRHGRSFPIEVGIADARGTRSWLIKPDERWRDWDWTDEALGLHGIQPEQLDSEGIDPASVIAELSRAIAGKRVVADSRIDGYWWDTLLEATPFHMASPIEHISCVMDRMGASYEDILHAGRLADRLCPMRHRAAADARWLWTLISTVQQALYDRGQPWNRAWSPPLPPHTSANPAFQHSPC